jgi:hypothetical protein
MRKVPFLALESTGAFTLAATTMFVCFFCASFELEADAKYLDQFTGALEGHIEEPAGCPPVAVRVC